MEFREMTSAEEFRKIVTSKFSFLEEKGFVRSPDLEESTPTVSTVVYLGTNVAFEVSFDLRDKCVDAEVIKVNGGKLLREWEGGYSSSLYTHLVQKERYRGSPSGGVRHAETDDPLTRMINGVAGLLNTAGQRLLDDNSDSLD